MKKLCKISSRVLRRPFGKHSTERGGAAIEYIIVSTFALLLAIAGVTFVGKTIKEKMKSMEDKLGISMDGADFEILK